MNRIYLDHSATTPLREEVFAAMQVTLAGPPGNATSAHAFGRAARDRIEQARDMVAAFVGAPPREIIFTGGGTESNNAAVLGLWVAARERGKCHIVASAIEHHAVLHAIEWLVKRRGATVTLVPPDRGGRVTAEAIRAAITPETGLVCLMHANNETGVVQPATECATLCAELGIALHCDAVQSAGRLPLDTTALPVASMALSAHKLYGPQGVGALFLRRDIPFEPVALGGAQERGRRAGTENVAGIVGMGVACALAETERLAESTRLTTLRDAFEAGVLESIPGTRVNGAASPRLPHLTNIAFDGLEGETLLQALDLEGIAVSTGAACSSGSLEASHVLLVMGQAPAEARSALRFSLGRGTTAEDLDVVAAALVRVVRRQSGRP